MRRAEELRTLFDLLQPIDDIRETDHHCNENRTRKVPFWAPVNRRSREPRLLDGGLRHTYAGREQSRGKGIGLGGQQRGCSPPPKLADTWWGGLGVWRATRSRSAVGIDARPVCRLGRGPRAKIMRSQAMEIERTTFGTITIDGKT